MMKLVAIFAISRRRLKWYVRGLHKMNCRPCSWEPWSWKCYISVPSCYEIFLSGNHGLYNSSELFYLWSFRTDVLQKIRSRFKLLFDILFCVHTSLFPLPCTPYTYRFLQHVRNRKFVLMGQACVGHYFKTRQAGPLSRNLYLNSSKILSNKLGNFNSAYCTIYGIVFDNDFRVTALCFFSKYIS